MQNDQGEIVDMYIPRKCTSSGKIIAAKDHASIQLTVADVDDTGRALSSSKHIAICGELRRWGESDDCINRICVKDGIFDKEFVKRY